MPFNGRILPCQPTYPLPAYLPIPHWSNNKQVTNLQSLRYDKTLKVNLQSWRTFEIVVIYVHCYFCLGPAPEIDATEQLIQKVAPIMIWLMGICICIYIFILIFVFVFIFLYLYLYLYFSDQLIQKVAPITICLSGIFICIYICMLIFVFVF